MRFKLKRFVFLAIIAVFTLALMVSCPPVEAAANTPAQVTGLTLTHVNHNTIKISWKKAKYAKEYQIYRSTAKNGTYKRVKTTTNRTFKNTNLNTGQKYFYKVRAVNGNKKGKFSAVKSFKVRLSKTKITEIESTETTAQLTIKSIQGANWYHVYRAESADGPFEKLTSAFDLIYIDEDLERGKEYFYKIRGIKKVEDGYRYGPFSEIRSVTTLNHNYESVVTEPGFTSVGYTTYTCANCGYSYIVDYIDPVDGYVKDEVERVSKNLTAKIKENNFTMLLASDMHSEAMGEGPDDLYQQICASNRHAGQAMSLIADTADVDLFGGLGDFAQGAVNTTLEQGRMAIEEAVSCLREVMGKTESVLLPGNHDSLLYSYDQNHGYLTDRELSELLGNYKYIDFADKKIRVICLNTSELEGMDKIPPEVNTGGEAISGEQLQWFARSLDLSSKRDAADWGIIILSHHPLDWGAIMPAANCLQAYLTGQQYSVTHDGKNISYNYSGKNAATVIAQFHGHLHNYKVDYIHYLEDGKAVATTVRRIAVPNTHFYRSNTYGGGNPEWYNIEFGEEVYYDKVANSAKDTAFYAVTIDLDKKRIYAYHYGAGTDRTVDYGTNSWGR